MFFFLGTLCWYMAAAATVNFLHVKMFENRKNTLAKLQSLAVQCLHIRNSCSAGNLKNHAMAVSCSVFARMAFRPVSKLPSSFHRILTLPQPVWPAPGTEPLETGVDQGLSHWSLRLTRQQTVSWLKSHIARNHTLPENTPSQHFTTTLLHNASLQPFPTTILYTHFPTTLLPNTSLHTLPNNTPSQHFSTTLPPQHFSTTLLHNTSPQHFSPTLRHNISLQHFPAHTSQQHSFPILLYNTSPQHFSTTLLHNTSPQHFSPTLRHNISLQHSFRTPLQHFPTKSFQSDHFVRDFRNFSRN